MSEDEFEIIRVIKFPAWKHLVGNKNNTPLERFLYLAIESHRITSGVSIDPKLILVSPNSYVTLYEVFKQYVVKYYDCTGKLPASVADSDWQEYGPLKSLTVPDGYIFLAKGYIYIK